MFDFSGQFLLDDRTLADYAVQKDSTLFLSVSWNTKTKEVDGHEKIKLAIHTLAGEFLTFEMRALDTIGGVKAVIEDKKSIPCEKQRLVYKGKALKNHSTLRDCNITTDSIVYLRKHVSED